MILFVFLSVGATFWVQVKPIKSKALHLTLLCGGILPFSLLGSYLSCLSSTSHQKNQCTWNWSLQQNMYNGWSLQSQLLSCFLSSFFFSSSSTFLFHSAYINFMILFSHSFSKYIQMNSNPFKSSCIF